jgi:hypothetical protein
MRLKIVTRKKENLPPKNFDRYLSQIIQGDIYECYYYHYYIISAKKRKFFYCMNKFISFLYFSFFGIQLPFLEIILLYN